jgi:hypothetical protein
MSRRLRDKPDPLESEIEAALDPGFFVSHRAGFEFVADLEAVAADVAVLVDSAPARAVVLYESFLAGCYAKAEEVDDSSGSFGMFVTDLFCGWIRARQAAGADAAETASRLLGWMDEDPYGFCHRLEQDVVTVLDKYGRAAFTEQVRSFEPDTVRVKCHRTTIQRLSRPDPAVTRWRWPRTTTASDAPYRPLRARFRGSKGAIWVG